MYGAAVFIFINEISKPDSKLSKHSTLFCSNLNLLVTQIDERALFSNCVHVIRIKLCNRSRVGVAPV